MGSYTTPAGFGLERGLVHSGTYDQPRILLYHVVIT